MLADFNIVALVINAGVKTYLAVAVAVKIAETDVPRIGHLDRPRKRLEGTDDPIAVKVGEGDVMGRINFNWQGETALTALFLGLQGVKVPVRGIAHFEFIADVVFD